MQPPPFIRPDVQAAPPVMAPDEPAAKKAKVDAGPEANLIPEKVFLQNHKGSVKFQVQVPDIPDKSEWKCQGQKIFLTLPWTDPVRETVVCLFFSEDFSPLASAAEDIASGHAMKVFNVLEP